MSKPYASFSRPTIGRFQLMNKHAVAIFVRSFFTYGLAPAAERQFETNQRYARGTAS
jgi:hypothetical protein